MTIARLIAFASTGILTCQMANADVQVTFQLIPDAFGANDMTPDGRFVCGDLDSNHDGFPDGTYRWDATTNITTTLDPEATEAAAISDDGSIILGTVPGPNPGNPQDGETAAIWNAIDGWASIGFLPGAGNCPSKSNGYELSGDGTIAVGLSWDGCSGRGFIWDADNGMQALQTMGSGGNRASVVSSDGSVIGGFAQGTSGRTPTTWNGSTLLGSFIGPPTNGSAPGEVLGNSDDGIILLGTMYTGGTDGVYDAVKWVNGGPAEVVGGGSILAGWAGVAQDIADDGTIVGFDHLLGNRRAWIQPDGLGNVMLLRDWANANGANIPANTELWVATAISANGRAIVGHGINPDGIFGFRIDIVPACPGDANGDGLVDIADLNLVLGNFGSAGPAGDVNDDNTVDIADLNLVLGNFGIDCN